jgi:hypothetical protein
MITPAALIGRAHFAISLSTNFYRYSGDWRSGATYGEWGNYYAGGAGPGVNFNATPFIQ